MQYTFTTPPASRAADRPAQIDDALVAEARRVLAAAIASLPLDGVMSRAEGQLLFAAPMTQFCAATRPNDVAIEKLIVAIKLAWGSLPETRLRFGESAPDALSAAVSACIDAYFGTEDRARLE